MSLSPGMRLGLYEVIAKLGEGGMGEVYRAKDSKLKREVALKVLPADVANDRERLARFQREAEVLAALNHPNIAQIYGLEDGALVMELVEGEDLAERLKRGAIPLDEALPIAKQIAEALEAAHEQGIIHRDLKPANIKVRPDGTVKVLDFGLAKALGPSEGDGFSRRQAEAEASALQTITSPAMTMRGMILGTAAYMAPEQAKGKAVDRRADIWAFGCVLFEMLSGTRAFKGNDVTDIITSVMRDTPDWNALPVGTPSSIRTLLRRCLEKDARQRLRDIGDARLELDGGANYEAPPVTNPRGRAWTVAPWAVTAALAMALAAIAMPRAPMPGSDSGGVMRFELAVPDGFQRITTRPGSMALSDDGEKLAFLAVNSTNRTQLFVREMSSLEARPIQLSGPAVAWSTAAPTWSPDGQNLLISVAGGGAPEVNDSSTQGGVVRKVDASGATTLLAEWGRYALWGSGAIIFGGKDGGIYRVSEDGGASTAMTTLDANAGEIVHLPSTFLPDGRRFIYMAQNRDTDKNAMFVASIDGGQPSRLAVPATRVVYARAWLWYIKDRTLIAQRTDPDTLRFEGGPISVVAGVGDFTVSRSGALVVAPPESTSLRMAWLDSQGVTTATVGDPGLYTGMVRPQLSPDGTRMVFLRPDASGAADVWQVDLERNVSTRLTATPNPKTAAIYSPDGKHIVFASTRSAFTDLYRRAADGSGSDELLLASESRKVPGSISPDGSVLLFGQSTTANGPDIWALPLVGDRTPRPLIATRELEGHAQFSPDGRWIAYCASESGEPDQVWVAPYPPTGARTRLSTVTGSAPHWSADGRQVYYGLPSGQIMRVSVTIAGASVRAAVPEAVLTAPELFSHNAFVLDARSRILALTPESNRKREPATVLLNWPALLKAGAAR